MVSNLKPKLASIAPYKQIENDLRRRIESGEWAVGMMIPSRRALADEYNVELPTVQRAVSGLLKATLLRADGGRGTFVAERPGFDSSPARTVAKVVETRQARIGIISSIRSVHDDGTVDPNYWNSAIIHSVERRVAAEGGSTAFANLVGWMGDEADTALAARRLADGGAQGILIVLARGGDIYHRRFASVCSLGLPVVYVGEFENRFPVVQVYFDDRDGGQHAALHLLDQGAKRIAFVAPFDEFWARDRMQGVADAIAFRGIDPAVLEPHFGPVRQVEMRELYLEEAAYAYAKRLIADGFSADAVVSSNDIAAYGFIRAAAEAGRRMGEDYTIMGFDDDAKSREIGLTSMRPPLEAMAEEAVRLMLDALSGARNGQRTSLHCDLIARQSTNASPPD